MATESDPNQRKPCIGQPDLPHEIIVDIIARLPVKSLLRFRCVCKRWLSLISNPDFVKKHLHIAATDENYRRHRLIVSNHDNIFRSCSLNSVVNRLSDIAIELDYPFKIPGRIDYIVGCYNGLLCIDIGDAIVFLLNPSTREFKRLPDLGVDLSLPNCSVSYGFGYDFSTLDYKVVALDCCAVDDDAPLKFHVNVYALKTNSWKKIQDFPYEYTPIDFPIFAGGALNWLVEPSDCRSTDFYSIGNLDLATDAYHIMPVPVSPDSETEFHLTLGVLGDCLCLLQNKCDLLDDVWVMKEYGVTESWTKILSIPSCVGVWSPGALPNYKPLWITKYGQLLILVNSYHLVVYNDQDHTFSPPVIQNSPTAREANIYVESLVSLNG